MRAALPLHAVVLGLHGAMVAHGYDDVEGDILTRARGVVGPECILAAEFDPHMHLTQARFLVLDLHQLRKAGGNSSRRAHGASAELSAQIIDHRQRSGHCTVVLQGRYCTPKAAVQSPACV
eukprot:COSAG04_NODE_910_length_9477_cov_7.097569_7_plen_121_part_00